MSDTKLFAGNRFDSIWFYLIAFTEHAFIFYIYSKYAMYSYSKTHFHWVSSVASNLLVCHVKSAQLFLSYKVLFKSNLCEILIFNKLNDFYKFCRVFRYLACIWHIINWLITCLFSNEVKINTILPVLFFQSGKMSLSSLELYRKSVSQSLWLSAVYRRTSSKAASLSAIHIELCMIDNCLLLI